MPLSREQYVDVVSKELGFHTPPPYVVERIEVLYRQRYTAYGAISNMRAFLALGSQSDRGEKL